jgi:flagellin-like protein
VRRILPRNIASERSSPMRGPSGIIGLIVTLLVIFLFLRLLGIV